MKSKKEEKSITINGNMDKSNAIVGHNNQINISYTNLETEAEHVRRLIVFFEGRRVLYQRNQVTPLWASQSVVEIRKRLISELETIDKKSSLGKSLVEMERACRAYLDTTEALNLGRGEMRVDELSHEKNDEFFAALDKLRDVFGGNIAQLSIQFDINVEGDLATIFPAKML